MMTVVNVSNPALDRFVGRVSELYSLPAVAVKVLDLTEKSKIDLRQLKEIVETDPALVVKILRVVNSSLFAVSRTVSDLNQALALLGIKPLKLLVLGFSLSERLCPRTQGAAVGRYWHHTLTQAVAAREISQRIWKQPGDDAFLAALLADVGMLVLLGQLGEPYARLLERPAAADRDVTDLESRILGFDHEQVGVRLLTNWKLPATIVAAIKHSADGEAIGRLPAAERALPQCVRLARRLADLLVDQRERSLQRLLEDPHGLSITVEQLADLAAALGPKVAQLGETFQFELPADTNHRDVIVEAHRRMSQLTTELAESWLGEAAGGRAPLDESALLEDVQALSTAVAQWSDAGVASATAPSASPQAPAPVAPAQPSSHVAVPATQEYSALAATTTAIMYAATLEERLTATIAICRGKQAPVSLVLVEIDQFEMVYETLGNETASALAARLENVCRTADLPAVDYLPAGDAAGALILAGCDRRDAVDQAERLLQAWRQNQPRFPGNDGATINVSVGVATAPSPAKNFPSRDLIEAARRCLSAAQLSHGTKLKSIGIY